MFEPVPSILFGARLQFSFQYGFTGLILELKARDVKNSPCWHSTPWESRNSSGALRYRPSSLWRASRLQTLPPTRPHLSLGSFRSA